MIQLNPPTQLIQLIFVTRATEAQRHGRRRTSYERFHALHTSQMLTYLRVTHLTVGLLLNFNSVVLREGIRRVAL